MVIKNERVFFLVSLSPFVKKGNYSSKKCKILVLKTKNKKHS